MLLLNYLTEGNLTKRYLLKSLNDEKNIIRAKKKFKEGVTKGQIEGNFEDDTWIFFTQGRRKRFIKFHAHEEEIRKNLSEEEYDRFILNLKTVTMLRFGTASQSAIGEMVRYILEERALSSFVPGVSTPRNSHHGIMLYYLLEFLRVTEWGSPEYIEECKKASKSINAENSENRKNRKHPCVLNEFESYYLFDRLLREAWKKEMTPLQKKFYFPLFLYWVLTTILPLRVTEFCVTPYDCLAAYDGRYFIDIRRTRLKGSTSEDLVIHYYTIEEDYYREEYEIPKWLYDIIEAWRQDTKDYDHPYELLFSLDYTVNLKYKGMFSRTKENTFDDKRLGQLLKQFYKEFICDHYGLVIVTEKDLLERSKKEDGSYQMYPGEIMMMHLKHTRHLAMINLIRWGCNPLIIKNFAGHTSTSNDAHYYNNVSSFIRSATRMLWERMQKADDAYVEEEITSERSNMHEFIDKTKKHVKVDKGKCYSEYFVNGDYSECFACNGDCDACDSLCPNKKIKVTKEEEKKLNEDVVFIMNALRNDRFEGKIEECNQKVLLLQAASHNFASKLWKEYMTKEEKEPECV